MRKLMLSILALVLLAACTPPSIGGGGDLATEVIVQATIFAPTETPTIVPTPEPPRRIAGVLLGADWDPLHPERVQYGIRTDVFMIVVADFPKDGDPTISLVSIPRDLLVTMPCGNSEFGTNRINAAWYLGGNDCVIDAIRENFDITINGPIVYGELRDFLTVVDRMGGIDIVPSENYTDFCGIMGTDTTGGEGYWKEWKVGQQYHLDGSLALCYVRGRRVSDGDLDRNRRALEFVEAAIRQWPANVISDPIGVADLFGEFVSNEVLTTNATPAQVLEYAIRILPNLNATEVRRVNFTLGQQVTFYTHPV